MNRYNYGQDRRAAGLETLKKIFINEYKNNQKQLEKSLNNIERFRKIVKDYNKERRTLRRQLKVKPLTKEEEIVKKLQERIEHLKKLPYTKIIIEYINEYINTIKRSGFDSFIELILSDEFNAFEYKYEDKYKNKYPILVLSGWDSTSPSYDNNYIKTICFIPEKFKEIPHVNIFIEASKQTKAASVVYLHESEIKHKLGFPMEGYSYNFKGNFTKWDLNI